MKKDSYLHIRISERDLNLIKRVAERRKLSLPKFVLAVLIPHCCKIESQDNGGEKC